MKSTIAVLAISLTLLTTGPVAAQPLARDTAIEAHEMARADARAGAALHARGEYRAAIDRYRRAQHTLQREEGVHTLSQLPLIDWMMVNYLLLGERDKADTQARFHYQIVIANHGVDSPESLPATVRLGDWCQSTEQLVRAKALYERALSIIDAHELGLIERSRPAAELAHVRELQRNWLSEPSTAAVATRMEFALKAQRAARDPMMLAMVREDHADSLAQQGELIASASIRKHARHGLLSAAALAGSTGD